MTIAQRMRTLRPILLRMGALYTWRDKWWIGWMRILKVPCSMLVLMLAASNLTRYDPDRAIPVNMKDPSTNNGCIN